MFRTVPILLFLALLAPLAAWAQTNPAYVVNDVRVDIVAESSVKARNQAFSAAQAKAFKMLSERFVGAEQAATLTPPDAATIAGMVSDFEITSEQLSTKRYLGTYIFRFKPASVNRFFGHGPTVDLSDAGAMGNKLLVLPVFSQNGDPALWDLKKNPWLQAWQNQVETTPSPLLIPKADVSDKMDIRETNAEKFTQSGIKRIRSRYNAYDVVIVAAVFDQTAKDILKINIYRTDRGRIELTQTLPVPTGSAKRLGELLAQAVPQTKAVLMSNWKNAPQFTDPYAVPETTVSETLEPQPNAPVAPPTPYAPQAGQLKATSYFSSMSDWLAIRRSLNGIPPLQTIRITALTTNQVNMDFVYSDWMALTSALSARGLALQSTGPGQYNLVKTSAPTGYNR